MIHVIFDYDEKYKKGILASPMLDKIRARFSVENKKVKYFKSNPGFQIPDRQYAITPSGRFELGLYREIQKFLYSEQIPVNVTCTPAFLEKIDTSYKISKVSELDITLRDYQENAVKRCLDYGSGVVEVATAGGKSAIMASLVKSVMDDREGTRTLIMVPSIQLVEQLYKDFLDYGFSPSSLSRFSGDNPLDETADIIIASNSILMSEQQDLSFLKNITLLLVDECHGLRLGNEINKIIKLVPTRHRFGFTGTLPENQIDVWNVIGLIGPVLYQKPRQELQDEKYIAELKMVVLFLSYLDPLGFNYEAAIADPTSEYERELTFIHNHPYRNKVIGQLVNNLNGNVLILVDRINQGEILLDSLKHVKGRSVHFIQGIVEVDDREKVRALMEKEKNVVCIAVSKIFSTGINIHNLPFILFASAGKAKIKIIQSIGRGLRMHKTKDRLVIFDIADNLHYGKKHVARRMELYRSENIQYVVQKIKEKERIQTQEKTG